MKHSFLEKKLLIPQNFPFTSTQINKFVQVLEIVVRLSDSFIVGDNSFSAEPLLRIWRYEIVIGF